MKRRLLLTIELALAVITALDRNVGDNGSITASPIATYTVSSGIGRHAYGRAQVVVISVGGTTPRRRNNRALVRRNGPAEAEKNCTEVVFGPFAGIQLELRLNVEEGSGADGWE